MTPVPLFPFCLSPLRLLLLHPAVSFSGVAMEGRCTTGVCFRSTVNGSKVSCDGTLGVVSGTEVAPLVLTFSVSVTGALAGDV